MVTSQAIAAFDSRAFRRPRGRAPALRRRVPLVAIGLALGLVGTSGCKELAAPDVPLPSRVGTDAGTFDSPDAETPERSDGGSCGLADETSTRTEPAGLR